MDTKIFILLFIFQVTILFLKMENPWSIYSIYELQYFNCPSCSFKDHSKQDFVNHAFEFHPEFLNYLKIHDNSLDDIIRPWEGLKKEIKIEETDFIECSVDPLNVHDDEITNEANYDISSASYSVNPGNLNQACVPIEASVLLRQIFW